MGDTLDLLSFGVQLGISILDLYEFNRKMKPCLQKYLFSGFL